MCQSKNLSNTWAKKFTPPTRHKTMESSNSHKSFRDKVKVSGLKRPCLKYHFWSKSKLSQGLLLPFSTSKWVRARKGADCKIEKMLPWKKAVDQARAKNACQRKMFKVTRLKLNRERLLVLPSADWLRENAWNEFWQPYWLIEYLNPGTHKWLINLMKHLLFNVSVILAQCRWIAVGLILGRTSVLSLHFLSNYRSPSFNPKYWSTWSVRPVLYSSLACWDMP